MLTPERWKRVESLFDGALDRDPSERDAWLRAECDGDADLLREVQDLLRSGDEAEGRFEQPAAVDAAHLVVEGLRDPFEGKEVGPYRLVEQIGRGGMGVVYRSERRDGQFQQDVVVKILRVGMHDDAGRERFRRERQILAQLTHENIARLLDGGVAPDGRPYIVMEPIDGLRIDLWCDQRQATLRERVELFLQVIDAVHFAHRNLVVHRDLKPSNVLVTDGGHVKLLDFGIAKMLDDDSDTEGATQTHQGLMTPDYASPEQVRGERITIASDVYQLGVLLYELLTGFLPYDLKSRSVFDVSHAICETAPAFPSRVHDRTTTRSKSVDLSTTGESSDPHVILAARRTSPVHIRRALAGDLDGILLKALQKDPTARYSSAVELGDDLRRHLDGLPIRAREGDPGYRLAKFVRRNAMALAGVVGVVLLVLGSIAFHANRVTAERNRAQQESLEKQQIADFLVEMFEVTDASKATDDEVTASALVERALARVESEDRSPSVEARMLLAIGEIGNKLGLHEQLQPALERAVDATRDVYGARSPEHAQALLLLSDNHRAQRQFEEAQPLLEEVVTILREEDDEVAYAKALRTLAEVHRDTDEPARALEEIDAALEILRRHFPDTDRDVLSALGSRAYVLRTLERYGEAEALYRAVIAGYRRLEDPDAAAELATMLNNYGFLLTRAERFDEAVAAYSEAARRRADAAGMDHPTTMMFRGNLVGALTRAERFDEAIEHSRALLDLKVERNGATHWSVAQAHHTLGRIYVQAGRFADAERELDVAVAGWTDGLGSDHAWTAMGRLWVGLTRLLQGDRASYDAMIERDLEAVIAGMGNNVVAGSYELFIRTLVANDHRELAEAHEAFRQELRVKWGLVTTDQG